MKISLNWINEFVNLDGLTTDEICEALTMSGLEVEGVEDQRAKYKDFIVAHIIDVEKHPNADRLTLCTVKTGSKEQKVICGAPNVERGQKVVLAKEGAVLPMNRMKIKKAKIRGVESNGMICAEDELGLSDDHSGIMVLDPQAKAGTPITEQLMLNDVIVDIAITPNRPDALSHIGVARDLAALFSRKMKDQKPVLKRSKHKASDYASVEIKDAENCPRYTAKVVLNAEVKESPEWIKKRLSAIGIRPINNVVDATNYILAETGQPLHAFDLDLLQGSKIIVKKAKEGSEFVTLDSQKRKLNKDVLMICDGKESVAIAGVMGGENSEVTENTKNILIESAYFNPSSIRRTSKYLGLSTEASYRFERGTNPEITKFAAERAAQIIAITAEGEVCSGTIDEYPEKVKPVKVKLRYERLEKILGYKIPKRKVDSIFENLGFKIVKKEPKFIQVKVPAFRPDIEREIDLIEEAARIYGYNNIPTDAKITLTPKERVDTTRFANEVKETLVQEGFCEIYTNSFTNEKLAKLTGRPIEMLNAQTSELGFLRTSLIPQILGVIEKNINAGQKDLRLFEFGNVFNLINEPVKSFEDFEEEQRLVVALTGRKSEKEWYTEEEHYDFYDLKGMVEAFLNKKFLDNSLNDSYNHTGNYLFDYFIEKKYKKSPIGYGGKIKKEILKIFDIDQDVYCFEFRVKELEKIEIPKRTYRELLKYPRVLRDFAFIFDKQVKYSDVEKYIRNNASPLLKDVKIFDIFSSESLGKDKKSMAIALEYYDSSRTLKDEEVDQDFNNLIDAVQSRFNAVLRGK